MRCCSLGILFNPKGEEVARAGANIPAFITIHYAQASPTSDVVLDGRWIVAPLGQSSNENRQQERPTTCEWRGPLNSWRLHACPCIPCGSCGWPVSLWAMFATPSMTSLQFQAQRPICPRSIPTHRHCHVEVSMPAMLQEVLKSIYYS